MIHAVIDAADTRNIVGFECGTRADFDKRHAGDPMWVFFDDNVIMRRVNTTEFLLNPKLYHIDEQGNLQKKYNPLPQERPDFAYITERKTTYLTDTDGVPLIESVEND
jgi:hypothetical protein